MWLKLDYTNVLEHLGAESTTFLNVVRELYRVCTDGAIIDIRVPHPRHDAFLADPTHVRPILLSTLTMFSKRLNLAWLAKGHANTPLALELDVDFELVAHEQILDRRWQQRIDTGQATPEDVQAAAHRESNVIEEIRAVLRVCKGPASELAYRCLAANDPAGCIEVCLPALEGEPDNADLWFVLATAMTKQGQLEGAELALRRTLVLRENHVGAWSDLALVLRKRGDFRAAMEMVERAKALVSDYPAAIAQEASLLATMGRYDEAVDAASKLVADHPGNAAFRTNLGTYLRQARRLTAAVAQLRLASQADPRDASARWNLALGLFQNGETKEAFQLSEARYRRSHIEAPPWVDHMWSGHAAKDHTLLLETEQGFGDAIQFIRFAHDAARGGTHVVVRCPERLVPLLSTAPGVSAAIPKGQEVAHDHIAWLMSVPAILGYGEAAVRRSGAYLAPDKRRAARFRDRLPQGPMRIGIAWQGNPEHEDDRNRSFPLAALAPVAELPKVSLVSLQRGFGSEQVGHVGFSVTTLGEDVDEDGAFLDTAAIAGELDLIITCDTALGHLAGALDIPCFVALPYAPDWRWQPGAPTTPWYRRHRLFTQPIPGDWRGVFSQMADAVNVLI